MFVKVLEKSEERRCQALQKRAVLTAADCPEGAFGLTVEALEVSEMEGEEIWMSRPIT